MDRDPGFPVGQELGVHECVEDFLQLDTCRRATLSVEEGLHADLSERGLALAVDPLVVEMRAVGVGRCFPRPQQHRVVGEIQHRGLAHQQGFGLVQMR